METQRARPKKKPRAAPAPAPAAPAASASPASPTAAFVAAPAAERFSLAALERITARSPDLGAPSALRIGAPVPQQQEAAAAAAAEAVEEEPRETAVAEAEAEPQAFVDAPGDLEGSHFYELVANARSASAKLEGLVRDVAARQAEVRAAEARVWRRETKKVDAPPARCSAHSRLVSCSKEYEVASIDEGEMTKQCLALQELRVLREKTLLLYEVEAESARLMVKHYIDEFLVGGPLFRAGLGESDPVCACAPDLQPPEDRRQADHVLHMLCVLFFFERNRPPAPALQQFHDSLHSWIVHLCSALLRRATLHDHLFILRCLACCPGCSEWHAQRLVQLPPPAAWDERTAYLFCELVATLARPAKRFVLPEPPVRALADAPPAAGEPRGLQPLEEDLCALLRQLPFASYCSWLMAGLGAVADHFSELMWLLCESLLNSAEYPEYAKLATSILGELVLFALRATCTRQLALAPHLDKSLVPIFRSLLKNPTMGASRFFCDFPIESGTDGAAGAELPKCREEWGAFYTQGLVDAAADLALHPQSLTLEMVTHVAMCFPGADIASAALDALFQLSCVNPKSRGELHHSGLKLLCTLCTNQPALVSQVLRHVGDHLEALGQEASERVCAALPLLLWQPAPADLELLGAWLRLDPRSAACSAARAVLGALNWGHHEDVARGPFLGVDVHRRAAAAIAEALDAHEAASRELAAWGWSLLARMTYRHADARRPAPVLSAPLARAAEAAGRSADSPSSVRPLHAFCFLALSESAAEPETWAPPAGPALAALRCLTYHGRSDAAAWALAQAAPALAAAGASPEEYASRELAEVLCSALYPGLFYRMVSDATGAANRLSAALASSIARTAATCASPEQALRFWVRLLTCSGQWRSKDGARLQAPLSAAAHAWAALVARDAAPAAVEQLTGLLRGSSATPQPPGSSLLQGDPQGAPWLFFYVWLAETTRDADARSEGPLREWGARWARAAAALDPSASPVHAAFVSVALRVALLADMRHGVPRKAAAERERLAACAPAMAESCLRSVAAAAANADAQQAAPRALHAACLCSCAQAVFSAARADGLAAMLNAPVADAVRRLAESAPLGAEQAQRWETEAVLWLSRHLAEPLESAEAVRGLVGAQELAAALLLDACGDSARARAAAEPVVAGSVSRVSSGSAGDSIGKLARVTALEPPPPSFLDHPLLCSYPLGESVVAAIGENVAALKRAAEMEASRALEAEMADHALLDLLRRRLANAPARVQAVQGCCRGCSGPVSFFFDVNEVAESREVADAVERCHAAADALSARVRVSLGVCACVLQMCRSSLELAAAMADPQRVDELDATRAVASAVVYRLCDEWGGSAAVQSSPLARGPVKAAVATLSGAIVASSPAEAMRLLTEMIARPQRLAPAVETFDPHLSSSFAALLCTAVDCFTRSPVPASILPILARFDVSKWLEAKSASLADRKELVATMAKALATIDAGMSGAHHQAWSLVLSWLLSVSSFRFPELFEYSLSAALEQSEGGRLPAQALASLVQLLPAGLLDGDAVLSALTLLSSTLWRFRSSGASLFVRWPYAQQFADLLAVLVRSAVPLVAAADLWDAVLLALEPWLTCGPVGFAYEHAAPETALAVTRALASAAGDVCAACTDSEAQALATRAWAFLCQAAVATSVAALAPAACAQLLACLRVFVDKRSAAGVAWVGAACAGVDWQLTAAADPSVLAPLLCVGLALAFRAPTPLPDCVAALCGGLAARITWSTLAGADAEAALTESTPDARAALGSPAEDTRAVRQRCALATALACAACGVLGDGDGELRVAPWAGDAHLDRVLRYCHALAASSARAEPVLDAALVRSLMRAVGAVARVRGLHAGAPLFRALFPLYETGDATTIASAAGEMSRETPGLCPVFVDAACCALAAPARLCGLTELLAEAHFLASSDWDPVALAPRRCDAADFCAACLSTGSLVSLYAFARTALQGPRGSAAAAAAVRAVDQLWAAGERAAPPPGDRGECASVLLAVLHADLVHERLCTGALSASQALAAAGRLREALARLAEDRQGSGLLGLIGMGRASPYGLRFRLWCRACCSFADAQVHERGPLRSSLRARPGDPQAAQGSRERAVEAVRAACRRHAGEVGAAVAQAVGDEVARAVGDAACTFADFGSVAARVCGALWPASRALAVLASRAALLSAPSTSGRAPGLGEGDARVTVAAPSEWLACNGVGADSVWEAGQRAVLLPESSDEQPLEPCSKCCEPFGKPNVALGSSSGSLVSETHGGDQHFVFDHCRSFCNSSRLHLGGRVVLALEIVGAGGYVVCRLHSEPLQFCSKSSLQAIRSRSASSSAASTPVLRPPVATLSPSLVPARGPRAEAEQSAVSLDGDDMSDSIAAGAPAAAGAVPEGPAEAGALARQMGELEKMQQENLARVFLLQQLLVMMGVQTQPAPRP
eukprot:m51a1_g333 hypothetical protein (2434) ;mRNA; r:480953-494021